MEIKKDNPIFKNIDKKELEKLISRYPELDLRSYPRRKNNKAINENKKK